MEKFLDHGEISIIPAEWMGITEVPKDAVEVPRERDGKLLLAHSESGHHHYIHDRNATLFRDKNDPNICYLRVDGAPVLLEQNKPRTDSQRHPDHNIPSGLFYVPTQQEWTPEGWRRVQD